MRHQKIPPPNTKQLPAPPRFGQMIGPSLILLGLGLGSGEVILWPYLSANFGLGIIWAAMVGITIQFFLNMEVERYTLVKGESVFVGFARYQKWLPIWFIFSTFIGFGWPGIIASCAKILSSLIGLPDHRFVAIVLIIVIGAILSFGPILYRTVENYQKLAISVGVPIIIGITIYLATASDWAALFRGMIGIGDGYIFLPKGIPLFTFLGALAYAGAGGNLNLSQSFYVKDKGYAMGAYADRIKSLFTKQRSHIELTGATFDVNAANVKRFRKWWRLVNLEHGIVFWGLGLVTIMLLCLLAYSTTYHSTGNAKGIDFILNEGQAIANSDFGIALGVIFLLVASLMLFGTQLTVSDSTSRIICENLVLANYKHERIKKIPQYYYGVLWSQLAFGIIVLLSGFSEPRTLIVLGAVINAVAMLVSFILILILNHKTLPKQLRPVWWRKAILILAIIFFSFLSLMAVLNGFGLVN